MSNSAPSSSGAIAMNPSANTIRARLRVDGVQHERRREEARDAAEERDDSEGRRVAPRQHRGREERDERRRRIDDGEVAVRDETDADRVAVAPVGADVGERVVRVPADAEQRERNGEQSDGNDECRSPPATVHSTSNSSAMSGSLPVSSSSQPMSGKSSSKLMSPSRS